MHNYHTKTYSFRNFLISEGGNVQIGDISAERIDLRKINREKAVKSFEASLLEINTAFQKMPGLPLWSKETLDSLDFLSGSAKHFFDLASIPTNDFVSVKPSVGDIDTKVDGAMADLIEVFLKKSTNKVFGTLKLIGYKKSGDQFITLWQSKDLGINVQVDLELVEFVNGRPTKWSSFSHSSSWDDMKSGIKGVFAKYGHRALAGRTAQPIILLKGKKQTPTKVNASQYTASLKGIRQRIQPVFDPDGKHQMINGLPVYTEIPSKGALFYNDLDVFFSLLFDGRKGTEQDLKDLESFVGIITLLKKYVTNGKEIVQFIERFAELLWGKGAQGLYRGNRLMDFREKSAAFRLLCSELKYSTKPFLSMIRTYYRGYK
jgi:hypothetical protein